jgi:CxxC-x17-CxxC domain-containing protein
MYAIGKTGMGKTNLLENIVIQDIMSGKGVCYIDPHGDTAEKLLKAIPKERINDVVYFNPADTDFPVAFNILEAVDEDNKNLVADGMMGVFKKIWPDVWSSRMEYILNNAILALLDYPGSTMLGVNRMMSDKDFRKRVYEKIKDPIVKGFWVNEFEAWEDRFRKEAVAAIQNKVGQFLSSAVIRNIVGQPKSTIDMRDIMDNQKIFIVNLSKGRIGEDAMRLLGGMIVTKMQLAAMGRIDIPEEERKDFYLCVDEFQNFVTESFASILSEARKYRLSLMVAHQYVSQLTFDGNTVVRDAVFGNVGTIISFRVGAEDAEFLEKEFAPVFDQNDLINLPKYNVYLKLMIDGVAGDAFSATSLPPVDLSHTEANEEKVIQISRERYAKDKKTVEEKIARWSGFLDPETIQNIQKMATKEVADRKAGKTDAPKKEKEPTSQTSIKKTGQTEQKTDERKMHKAKCDTCEMEIEVPFKPDGSRPTFCKDCFKDYQRAVAKAQNEQSPAKPKDDSGGSEKAKIFSKRPSENSSQKVYASGEKPITLSQASHIAPKKFKNFEPKKQPDFEKIRNMINKNKPQQDKDE